MAGQFTTPEREKAWFDKPVTPHIGYTPNKTDLDTPTIKYLGEKFSSKPQGRLSTATAVPSATLRKGRGCPVHSPTPQSRVTMCEYSSEDEEEIPQSQVPGHDQEEEGHCASSPSSLSETSPKRFLSSPLSECDAPLGFVGAVAREGDKEKKRTVNFMPTLTTVCSGTLLPGAGGEAPVLARTSLKPEVLVKSAGGIHHRHEKFHFGLDQLKEKLTSEWGSLPSFSPTTDVSPSSSPFLPQCSFGDCELRKPGVKDHHQQQRKTHIAREEEGEVAAAIERPMGRSNDTEPLLTALKRLEAIPLQVGGETKHWRPGTQESHTPVSLTPLKKQLESLAPSSLSGGQGPAPEETKPMEEFVSFAELAPVHASSKQAFEAQFVKVNIPDTPKAKCDSGPVLAAPSGSSGEAPHSTLCKRISTEKGKGRGIVANVDSETTPPPSAKKAAGGEGKKKKEEEAPERQPGDDVEDCNFVEAPPRLASNTQDNKKKQKQKGAKTETKGVHMVESITAAERKTTRTSTCDNEQKTSRPQQRSSRAGFRRLLLPKPDFAAARRQRKRASAAAPNAASRRYDTHKARPSSALAKTTPVVIASLAPGELRHSANKQGPRKGAGDALPEDCRAGSSVSSVPSSFSSRSGSSPLFPSSSSSKASSRKTKSSATAAPVTTVSSPRCVDKSQVKEPHSVKRTSAPADAITAPVEQTSSTVVLDFGRCPHGWTRSKALPVTNDTEHTVRLVVSLAPRYSKNDGSHAIRGNDSNTTVSSFSVGSVMNNVHCHCRCSPHRHTCTGATASNTTATPREQGSASHKLQTFAAGAGPSPLPLLWTPIRGLSSCHNNCSERSAENYNKELPTVVGHAVQLLKPMQSVLLQVNYSPSVTGAQGPGTGLSGAEESAVLACHMIPVSSGASSSTDQCRPKGPIWVQLRGSACAPAVVLPSVVAVLSVHSKQAACDAALSRGKGQTPARATAKDHSAMAIGNTSTPRWIHTPATVPLANVSSRTVALQVDLVSLTGTCCQCSFQKWSTSGRGRDDTKDHCASRQHKHREKEGEEGSSTGIALPLLSSSLVVPQSFRLLPGQRSQFSVSELPRVAASPGFCAEDKGRVHGTGEAAAVCIVLRDTTHQCLCIIPVATAQKSKKEGRKEGAEEAIMESGRRTDKWPVAMASKRQERTKREQGGTTAASTATRRTLDTLCRFVPPQSPEKCNNDNSNSKSAPTLLSLQEDQRWASSSYHPWKDSFGDACGSSSTPSFGFETAEASSLAVGERPKPRQQGREERKQQQSPWSTGKQQRKQERNATGKREHALEPPREAAVAPPLYTRPLGCSTKVYFGPCEYARKHFRKIILSCSRRAASPLRLRLSVLPRASSRSLSLFHTWVKGDTTAEQSASVDSWVVDDVYPLSQDSPHRPPTNRQPKTNKQKATGEAATRIIDTTQRRKKSTKRRSREPQETGDIVIIRPGEQLVVSLRFRAVGYHLDKGCVDYAARLMLQQCLAPASIRNKAEALPCYCRCVTRQNPPGHPYAAELVCIPIEEAPPLSLSSPVLAVVQLHARVGYTRLQLTKDALCPVRIGEGEKELVVRNAGCIPVSVTAHLRPKDANRSGTTATPEKDRSHFCQALMTGKRELLIVSPEHMVVAPGAVGSFLLRSVEHGSASGDESGSWSSPFHMDASCSYSSFDMDTEKEERTREKGKDLPKKKQEAQLVLQTPVANYKVVCIY